MKISAQEEYGLRIILDIARSDNDLTIEDISQSQNISKAYAAKLLRLLRIEGFVESSRGQNGGYRLSKPSDEIQVGHLLNVLGGKLFDESFCGNHTGIGDLCTNSVDCSIRSLWQILQNKMDEVLQDLKVSDLVGGLIESRK